MSLHKPAHKNTEHPPGQIKSEEPHQGAVKAAQDVSLPKSVAEYDAILNDCYKRGYKAGYDKGWNDGFDSY